MPGTFSLDSLWENVTNLKQHIGFVDTNYKL